MDSLTSMPPGVIEDHKGNVVGFIDEQTVFLPAEDIFPRAELETAIKAEPAKAVDELIERIADEP